MVLGQLKFFILLFSIPCFAWAEEAVSTSNQTPSPIITDPLALAPNAVFRLITSLTGANSPAGHGTAFAVSNDGLLITNFHVVARALLSGKEYQLFLMLPEGGQLPATVVNVDPVNDLALIKVNKSFATFLNLATAEVLPIGTAITSLGFPQTEQLSTTQGMLNGERLMGFASVVLASIVLNPGMSGGPILNAHGKVVAVNRAIAKTAQSISYLSPLVAIHNLLNTQTTTRIPASKMDWVCLEPATKPPSYSFAGHKVWRLRMSTKRH